ncbi:MAG: hypothetical protein MUF29_04965 [Chitinophagaceae bacterium]|jgi:hypothetical protein|nr:hypothetical protein [Chitinophagaceae bacterium]
MKTLTIVLAMLCACMHVPAGAASPSSPLSKYSALWNQARLARANTARNSVYLSRQEKEMIHILNLARMEPRLFAKTVLPHFGDTASSTYFRSLRAELLAMAPLPPLLPDSLCWVSARCHALSSGQHAYEGHERITDECRKLEYFMGECCHYGQGSPLDMLVSLLIDEGIPSLGHRRICLGRFEKIGASIQPHSEYGLNVVLDFY